MILEQVQISNLRNLSALRLNLHPHINLISGLNGSGKTSFLEAIYLLGTGRSFRAREIASLITYNQNQLTVFAKTADEQSISISKSLSSVTTVRINSAPCVSSSDLAHFLPTQVFYQDIFQIIDAGPGVRRGLLDWGLFHVKHQYHSIWKDYRRALKQRNALLKKQVTQQELLPWNKILSELGEQMDEMRREYIFELNTQFHNTLKKLTSIDCELHYYKGWDKRNEGKSLEKALSDSFANDCYRQYTHYGPHQADLIFMSDEHKSKLHLSRGQQKIILFALKFAQASLLQNDCVYLIDDISAELDAQHLSSLLTYISSKKGQFILTSHTDESILEQLSGIDYQGYRL